MNNENLETKVTILPPFKRFCMTIGELPTSYVESMTYYESLVWLCNYLSKTVIPAINTNGEAVTELQEKYIELKDYVDNYFDNLDVQTEIDNKLDDMAESGQLAEIIAAYLEVASILGFDTKADLKAADNLIEGSFARTLGTTSYNDGKGNFYKIRALEESDVIDDDNLLALAEYPSLVAEKMPDYRMNSVESRLDTLEDTTIPSINSQITSINSALINNRRRIILIGDSYAQNDRGITGWMDKVTSYLDNSGYTFISLKKGGIGFKRQNDGINVEQLLTNASGSISDKNTVTDIIVALGYNDQSYTQAEIEDKVESFCTYCKTNYPNANIQIGMIGWTADTGVEGAISNLRKVRNAYANDPLYGGCYMKDIEYTLHNYIEDFYSDSFHPSEIGTSKIAKNIINFIFGVPCTNNIEFRSAYNNKIYESQQNNRCNVFVYNDCQINVSINSMVCDGNTSYTLDTMTPVCVNGVAEGGGNFKGSLIVHSSTAGYIEVEANIIFGKNIVIRPKKLASSAAWLTIADVNWVMINQNNWSIPTEDC